MFGRASFLVNFFGGALDRRLHATTTACLEELENLILHAVTDFEFIAIKTMALDAERTI